MNKEQYSHMKQLMDYNKAQPYERKLTLLKPKITASRK
jgi:hypothetical protein